jgi:hypothetical protein
MPNDNDDINVWGHLQLSPTSLSRYSEQQVEPPEFQRLLEEETGEEEDGNDMQHIPHDPPAARAFLIRSLALFCACSLSVGSH